MEEEFMALPKKHSRLLTLDSVHYRWQVSRNSCCQYCGGGLEATFVVQQVEPQGALLIVDAPEHTSPIVPAIVTASIRRAISRGWRPTQPGRPFHLDALPKGEREDGERTTTAVTNRNTTEEAA
ncbi:hypothetical protein [Streptomyces sp. NPDC056661]|uniref:hypothetical protein n=1 Tax=Streptomyces sp. NPDC056661 TaxID=3345898 RepID=UPI003695F4A3